MKKNSKTVKILIIILLIPIVLLIGLAVFHRCRMSADRKFAEKCGYINPVSVGNYSLNMARFGNENADHKIVALSGMGPGFPVEIRKMTTELEKDY